MDKEITLQSLLDENIKLKYQINIKNNEIMSLKADLAMANDMIKFLHDNINSIQHLHLKVDIK